MKEKENWSDLTKKEKEKVKNIVTSISLFFLIGLIKKELLVIDKIFFPRNKFKSELFYKLRYLTLIILFGILNIFLKLYFNINSYLVESLINYFLFEILYFSFFKTLFITVLFKNIR